MAGLTLLRALRRPLQALVVLNVVIFSVGLTGGVASADPNPMAISMTSSPNPVASGASLTYTIVVQNTGGSRVNNVNLHDQINGMKDLILQSDPTGTCTQSANLVSCTQSDFMLAGGETWTVTIRGTVTAPNGTTLHNVATAGATKSAQSFNVTATVDTLVQVAQGSLPDLTISINAPSSAAAGSTFTYTLIVNNETTNTDGTANANDIRVVDTLPPGAASVGAITTTSLFTCTAVLPNVTCDGGRINAGSNGTINIPVTLSIAASGVQTNTAQVDPLNTIPETNEFNNSATANTTVSGTTPGTLTVTKSAVTTPSTGTGYSGASTGDVATPDDTLTYTVIVTNPGTRFANDVVVVDGTQGLDAASISAVNNNGSCVVAAPKVTCVGPGATRRLNAGESMTITIAGTVVAAAGTKIINTATVTGNISNIGVSNTATKQTTIRPKRDLTVTKSSLPNPAQAANTFTYTWVIGNSGVYDASPVELRDPLPAGILPPLPGGFVFTVPALSGFVCTVSLTNVVDCVGGTVLAASTVTISLAVVAPQTTGPIVNTATVDPNNFIAESDESNNTSTITTGVNTGIDLTITKSSNTPVATSGNLTYTILVSNIGTQDTTGVVVRDTLPAGTIFRSASGDHNFTCSETSPGVVECIHGIINGTYTSFPGTDTATITILTFAPPIPGVFRNIVRVDPDKVIDETDETNNIFTFDTTVTVGGPNAFNELTITKVQASPANPVAPSGTVVYTITIDNTGSDPAFNVKVRDFLPAGSTYVSAADTVPVADGFLCTEAALVVNCGGARIDPLSPKSITITIRAPATPGTYTNQAIVDPDFEIPEGNEANNAASVLTVVALGGGAGFIELHITSPIAQSPANPVAPSSIVTYTITVENSGTDRAFNVEVRDFLPAGFRFLAAVGSDGFFCSESGGVVNCTGGSIAGGGGTETITVQAFTAAQPSGGGILYTNQASVDPDHEIPEADETNNSRQVTTTVSVGGASAFIDLTTALTDAPDYVEPGANLTYTLTVTNGGDATAFNVTVQDTLPAGTTFVSATGTDGFTCTEAGGVVTCTGGTVAGSSGTQTITIVVKAPLADGITIVDLATADPDNDIPESNEGNNSSSTSTAVESEIDLTVTNDGSGAGSSGTTGTWAFSVTNNVAAGSGSPASGVVVKTTLPIGVIPLDVVAPSGWTCETSGDPINVVTCVGDLAAGATASFTVNEFTTADGGSTITSQTVADPDNTIVESDEGNNTASDSATA